MSSEEKIECKPSKWFKSRAILMSLMMLFFAGWFLSDGLKGYPKENVEYVEYQAFTRGEKKYDWIKTIKEAFDSKTFSEEEWREYASKQTFAMPEDTSILPKDYPLNKPWPKEVTEGYALLKTNNQSHKIWKDYSYRMGYDSEAPEKLHDKGSIREQLIVSGICGLLLLGVLYWAFRINARSMVATAEGYTAPGGKLVPFSAMKKLDKRKWNSKGVATITYEEEGQSAKAKIDGFLYGGFKKEDDEPAEKLMAFIEERFKGEIIEYATEEDSEEETPEAEDKAAE